MLPGDLLIICCRIEDFFGNRERIPYEQNLIWKVGKYVIVKKKNSRLTLDGGSYHIGTGFYMIGTSVMKGLSI